MGVVGEESGADKKRKKRDEKPKSIRGEHSRTYERKQQWNGEKGEKRKRKDVTEERRQETGKG